MNPKNRPLFLIYILCFCLSSYSAQETFIRTSGDVLEVALPLSAIAMTLIEKDPQGSKEFLIGFGVNFLTTHSLKRLINKERPNGGNHAFPSGHTAASFFSAAFIYKRYGKKYGIPALVIASYVGYSRFQGKSPPHDIWDVLGGAALGSITALLFTTSVNNKIQLSPSISQNSFILGARISIGS